ncbi:MAG: GAF domain-containing sensor histidine kinase [Chloroflexi bacterium]|nr:GAF domain-containing sensor histidine kinase [Chloroflexota bacterium]
MEQDILTRVLDISRRMAQTRSLSPLLTFALDEAMTLVGAERGYIVLVQPDGTLEFRVVRDIIGTSNPEDAADQISSSILTQVVSKGEPLVISDALSDSEFSAAASVLELKLRSVMCVPLLVGGTVLGAIYVENRSVSGMFTDEDLPPLVIFANQAAVAIENAILNDQLEARVAARTAELKQALEQIESDWQEAEESYRLRSLVLGGVAHDIRAPLVVATTALSMIEDGSFGSINDEQNQWVNKSIDALNHAMDLIQDVFDLAKIEMGQFGYDPEYTDLGYFLRSVYATAEGLPWAENVEFVLDLADDLPDVLLDPIHIRRVIFNLLSNALKFTTEGTVTLYAAPDNGRVVVGVRDTGEGIPPEQLDKLFERFHQADNNIARRRKGTGLGLAISREMIDMHNGEIWVESVLGEGADFKFTLPVTAVEPEE